MKKPCIWGVIAFLAAVAAFFCVTLFHTVCPAFDTAVPLLLLASYLAI